MGEGHKRRRHPDGEVILNFCPPSDLSVVIARSAAPKQSRPFCWIASLTLAMTGNKPLPRSQFLTSIATEAIAIVRRLALGQFKKHARPSPDFHCRRVPAGGLRQGRDRAWAADGVGGFARGDDAAGACLAIVIVPA